MLPIQRLRKRYAIQLPRVDSSSTDVALRERDRAQGGGVAVVAGAPGVGGTPDIRSPLRGFRGIAPRFFWGGCRLAPPCTHVLVTREIPPQRRPPPPRNLVEWSAGT